MGIVPTLVADLQAAELMQPTRRAFDQPSHTPQSAAVVGAGVGDSRLGAYLAQRFAVRLRVTPPVGV